MTVRMTEQGVIEAIEVAVWAGSAIGLLIVALLVWLIVRPPRHVRAERPRRSEADLPDAEEMMRLLDRMERRLETLERAVEPPVRDEQRTIETAAESGDQRREG